MVSGRDRPEDVGQLMASIVEELQRLAYESAVPIADLLRRVKVAATKLGLSGAVAWVRN